jgi:hypothetical protein
MRYCKSDNLKAIATDAKSTSYEPRLVNNALNVQNPDPNNAVDDGSGIKRAVPSSLKT